MHTLKQRYGNTALLTGSTVGIGAAYATLLAQQGIDLVTVARNAQNLEQQAQALRQQYGIKVTPIVADLSSSEGVQALIDATQSLTIDMLISNAGVIDAQHLFDETPLPVHLRMLQLNVSAPMQLAHHFAQSMVARGKGAILLMSSISALMPEPFLAHYGATKAFIHSLATSMHFELKPKGVHVAIVSPGPTDTPMLTSTGIHYKSLGIPVSTPHQVAYCGLRALANQQRHVIPGVMNKLMVLLARLSPEGLSGWLIRWILKQGFKSPAQTW